jgi:hypothetical protein
MKPHARFPGIIPWVFAALLIVGVGAIWWRMHPRPPVTDVARYQEMRREVERDAGADAVAFMPKAVPGASKRSIMRAFASRGSPAAELILLCILPPQEARDIAQAARAKAKAIDEKDGVKQMRGGLRGREFPTICIEGDLPKSYEVIPQYANEVSAGTDETHVWLLVDEPTGTVVWWLERHWAPYN